MLDQAVNRLRAIHDRYARVILAGIAALLLPLMMLTAAATLDNWQQNNAIKAATTAQDELLACFDEYAAASSVSSKAVREASAEKDVATAEAWAALNREGVTFLRLTKKLLNRTVTPADFEALSDSLADRARAGRALERAQAHLDATRAKYPVPDPPSEFCDSQPLATP